MARAHEPGLSTLHLVEHEGQVEIVIQFAPGDLAYLVPVDIDGNGTISRSEFESGRAAIEKVAGGWVQITGASGTLTAPQVSAQFEEADINILLRATMPVRPRETWTLTFPRLIELPPGHRHFVTVTDQHNQIVTERLIGAAQPWIRVDWNAAGGRESKEGAGVVVNSPAEPAFSDSPFRDFLKLGIAHILTGYDHLLFLAGLLLACRRFASIAAVITSFTVAHSITLALATFQVAHFPSRWVEPLIAATIVYVGVENIVRRGAPTHRWLLTFAFGLVHGFGFASVLRELGVGQDGRPSVTPLLSFNLGVELGQIFIAALFLPLLWWARRFPVFEKHGTLILSAFVVAAGLYWLVERVT